MAKKKILMLVGDYVEDYEVMVPFQALRMIGHQVDVVCPGKEEGDQIITAIHEREEDDQTYSEKPGHHFTLNASFDDVYPEDYNALIISGGRSPEYLRLDSAIIEVVQHFNDEKKPIAAIGHGPQVLITAGILEGRECTGNSAIGPDIEQAGGTWVELDSSEICIDDNLVTAPSWAAHPALLEKFLELLKTKIEL